MKISNEAKVGILAIVAILILVIGFNFLKGKSLFKETPTIYAVFSDLGALEKSNMVKINGLPIGTVYQFKPVNDLVDSIIVEIHLTRDVSIPTNSIAIIDATVLQSSYITIEKGTANTYLQSGDTISTKLVPGLMGNIKTQLAPTVTRVNETLDSLKITLGNLNSIFDPNTNNNLRTMITNLTITSAHLQRLLNAETGALAHTISNLNSVTDNLAKNNEAVGQSIRNVEITTANLANARIQETVAAIEGTINELKGTTAELKNSVNRINSKDGSLGLLLNDRKFYDQLNRAALSAEILMDDMRLHPKRYVNISVFGGKGSPSPITSPAIKDTIPGGKR
ncbi:MAG: MlaD family protein [Chitinophagaceae bacterium]